MLGSKPLGGFGGDLFGGGLFGGGLFGGGSLLCPKKAAIYTRVSTLTQVKEGYGLEIQEDICRKFCSMRAFEVYKVYTDDGVSGTKKPTEREGMTTLMNDAKNNLFSVVIFSSLDRIAREIMITFQIINFFTDNNIVFFSCKECIDNTTYQGKFKLSIYAAVSELELNTIKARLAMGREMKKRMNGDIGGRMPYGYSRSDKGIVPRADQVLVIQGIFDAHYNKGLSMNAIARILNEEKIPTPRNGKKWYASTIKSLLSNRSKYDGGLINENNGGVCWPQIIINNK